MTIFSFYVCDKLCEYACSCVWAHVCGSMWRPQGLLWCLSLSLGTLTPEARLNSDSLILARLAGSLAKVFPPRWDSRQTPHPRSFYPGLWRSELVLGFHKQEFYPLSHLPLLYFNAHYMQVNFYCVYSNTADPSWSIGNCKMVVTQRQERRTKSLKWEISLPFWKWVREKVNWARSASNEEQLGVHLLSVRFLQDFLREQRLSQLGVRSQSAVCPLSCTLYLNISLHISSFTSKNRSQVFGSTKINMIKKNRNHGEENHPAKWNIAF